jgi:hypothetical protein
VWIHISEETVFYQTAWSVDYCKFCDRFEAFRLGEKHERVALYGVPVSREVYRVALCDCCRQRSKLSNHASIIPFDEWQPTEGIRSLFEKCAPHLLPHLPTLRGDDELKSLLTVARRRSTQITVGPGAFVGLLVGLAAMTPVALVMTLIAHLEPVGFVWFLTLSAGMLLGAVVGGIVSAVAKKRTKARGILAEACAKYGLDPVRLASAADSFPRRIRLAAEALLRDDLRETKTGQV